MNEVAEEISRRKFLKMAGAGSLALAALPAISQVVAAGSGNGYTNFHFMALSQYIDGADVHNLLMGGHGKVNAGTVVGNGSFQHQLASAPGLPKPILGQGTWKAKRLLEFTTIGTFGIGVAGILEMAVHLVTDSGSVIPAVLEVVCNIPPGGHFTGKPEGYVLDAGGPIGPFKPLVPPLGITWFTSAVEPKD